MVPTHLVHKYGGRITKVSGIGHATDGGKIPFWFYVCDIAWQDSSPQKEAKVEPILVCRETDDVTEVNELAALLSNYLAEEGEWLEKPKHIGDYVIHWLPRKKSGFRAIA